MEHQDDDRHSYGHHHIARKLNFNAPLLTTRRPAANVDLDRVSVSGSVRISLSTTSDRVPFCWEQAPGKPKEYAERCHDAVDHGGDSTTPRPTLPPGWWRPPVQTSNSYELFFNNRLYNYFELCPYIIINLVSISFLLILKFHR